MEEESERKNEMKVLNGVEIAEHGDTVRVPLRVMDGKKTADAVLDAHDEYDERLREAWRGDKPAATAKSNQVEAAYDKYDDDLENKWKEGKRV